MLLVAVALSGCIGSVSASANRQRIINYEASLRAEADWMWDNMNYTQTHYRLEAGRCIEPDFKHQPVTLGDSLGQDEKQMVEHLDYAALLLKETREQWRDYCQTNGGAASPAAFMESRLRPTYEGLNQVRLLLSSERATPGPYK